MMDFLYRAIVIGVGATAIFDLWAIFLNRAFAIPLPNWAMTGRWFLHLPQGRFTHESIANSPPMPNELAAGWIGHYLIGIAFAAITLVIGGGAWAQRPTLLPPLIVGWVTVGCGWFILQPGMGAGVAASKRPDANRVRLLNILGHTVFGLGMFAVAWLIR